MPEAEARRPDPSISLILRPKWLTARARALANERGRGARFFLLSLIGMLLSCTLISPRPAFETRARLQRSSYQTASFPGLLGQ